MVSDPLHSAPDRMSDTSAGLGGPFTASTDKNMRDAQDLIVEKRYRLSQHPFLIALEQQGSLDQIRRIVPRLAFFVLCFQDVLRVANEKTTDPEIKNISEGHQTEDAGHDIWYLHDLAKLDVPCDVAWLFSREHQLTRDVAYSQIAEVLKATDDRTRLAVVLSLEAIGAEFFGRVIGFLDRIGAADDLKYFARGHQQIESEHQIFEDGTQARLATVTLSAEVWDEVVGAVNDTFVGMTRLATDLYAAFVHAP